MTYDAVILDLDGVITQTAAQHARAWKRMFDAFLAERAPREKEDHTPLDIDVDYFEHIDGKPRYDGVRSFLASRNIELPEGNTDDPPHAETVYGLGNRKNELFRELLESEGAETFDDAVEQIDQWRQRDIRLAIVSSSRNARRILNAAGVAHCFDAVVDGSDIENTGLKGKPAPDMFLEAAQRLGVPPGRCILVEDAAAGVAAGRAGDFGLVVGVDRDDYAEGLRKHGADLVVRDLRDIPKKISVTHKDG